MRFYAFLKDTWWLWLIYLIVNALFILFVGPVFWAVLPMMIVNFVYFAYIRYDEEGNFIGA
jgi:type IV secretory pathway VirB3-like protein